MTSKKVLFISQAIEPYVPASVMAEMGREIPGKIQEMGNEIRVFLPKWGTINERKNQLHEVIRLSGLNIIINDVDHMLIVKVASLTSAKIQVYFIDNEDFFHVPFTTAEESQSTALEGGIFYCRSVLETIKKLRWKPDIIHCQGPISATAPYFIKTAFKNDPSFKDTKVVYSFHGLFNNDPLPLDFKKCLAFRDYGIEEIESMGIALEISKDVGKLVMKYSDGIIVAEENVPTDLLDYAREQGTTILPYEQAESQATRFAEFYDSLFN